MNWHDILGVSKNATPDQIHTAFLKKLKKLQAAGDFEATDVLSKAYQQVNMGQKAMNTPVDNMHKNYRKPQHKIPFPEAYYVWWAGNKCKRATRFEYWAPTALNVFFASCLLLIPVVGIIFYAIYLSWRFSNGFKRLHDAGFHGAFAFVPIVGSILMLFPSNPEPNKYGRPSWEFYKSKEQAPSSETQHQEHTSSQDDEQGF